MGIREMRWEQLNKVIEGNLERLPSLSFIIIQVGSNDLGNMKSYELYTCTKMNVI